MKTEKSAIYQNGIASLTEYAKRSDGVWFVRYQERTFRGFRWTAWKSMGIISHDLPSGVYSYHLTERMARLTKAGAA